MNYAVHCVLRWSACCRPGMYLANLSSALEWKTDAHLHAHCVVDDFGMLQPIAFTGLTVQNKIVEVRQ